MTDKIIVLDFGSQYNQLIARRIREMGVYSALLPHTIKASEIKAMEGIKGIVFSGGPKSVYDDDAFKVDEEEVWMSHGDHVAKIPQGFKLLAKSQNGLVASIANEEKKIYCVQFHPEVRHTVNGNKMLHNFVFEICHANNNWSMKNYLDMQIEQIRKTVKDKKVLCGLSGGVDSTVVAVLLHKAIGHNLTCMFIDHGLLRQNEGDEVMAACKKFDMNVIRINAKERFLSKLQGVTDPEKKRKIIGNEFVYCFDEESRKLGDFDFLAQGTLYTDVIESGTATAQTIKSHHNVGGLPKDMKFKLIEPLNVLFKDEVRALGLEMGLPYEIVWRQPFPGPGLAIRIIGDITEEKLEIVRKSDAILREEIASAGLDKEIWQYFTALTNMKSVGVMGDGRTYNYAIAIRAVTSIDGMTADWARIPYDVLDKISRRIVNEVAGVNRVLLDCTSKPPATIEFE